MIRNLFWFTLGIGATAAAVIKGRELYRRVTPAGVSDQIAKRTDDARDAVTDFLDTYTRASRQRERELRDALGMNDHEGLTR